MKTRIRLLDDGSHEMIRLFSPEDLESLDKDDPLLFEKSVVWLVDVKSLPYVRTKVIRTARSRRGPISFGDAGRVVGYSKLTPNAPRCPDTKGYVRRVFYLKNSDCLDQSDRIPISAYDPTTIMPGVKGEHAVAAAEPSEVQGAES